MNINYSHLIPYISTARANAIQSSFNGLLNDRQIIGVYLWQQEVISKLQPIVQILEVALRNSLHYECLRRFKNCTNNRWWEDATFTYKMKNNPSNSFLEKIYLAEKTFKNNYKRKNQSNFKGTVNADDIVANATLSCWEHIVHSNFLSKNRSQNQNYLWPISFTRVFRGLSPADKAKSPTSLIHDLSNLIKSFRDLRNRASHHDCLWSKSSLSGIGNLEHAALQVSTSITNKINKLAELLEKVAPQIKNLVDNWGLFLYIDKAVSTKNLLRYLDKKYYQFTNEKEKNTFFSIYINYLNSCYQIAKNSSEMICR